MKLEVTAFLKSKTGNYTIHNVVVDEYQLRDVIDKQLREDYPHEFDTFEKHLDSITVDKVAL